MLYDPEDWRLEDLKQNIISKDEYIILKGVDEKYKNYYFSRNYLGDIYMTEEKPLIRFNDVLMEKGEFFLLIMFNNLFKTIKYGNGEPKRVIDYIKEYEQCHKGE